MIIQLNEKNEIISIFKAGEFPNETERKYEVLDNEFTDEILNHIFDYKYENNSFIKKDNAENIRLEKLKKAKISNMSTFCSNEIIKGVNFKGKHYSLTLDDQTNISNLSMLASLGNSVPYHADSNEGANCELFTPQEFLEFSNYCQMYKLFHLTYYNQLKGYINSLNTIEEVLNINYGVCLKGEYLINLKKLTNNFDYTLNEINDYNSYEHILNDSFL